MMKKIKDLDCILLVDDDEATNFLHEMIIENEALDVFVQTCSGGEDALDYLGNKGAFSAATTFPQPGIIFLDINMPRMNGWEFLDRYRDLPEKQKAKVVVTMLTSSLNPDDELNAACRKDVKEFIHKPLTQEKLGSVISKYFGL